MAGESRVKPPVCRFSWRLSAVAELALEDHQRSDREGFSPQPETFQAVPAYVDISAADQRV